MPPVDNHSYREFNFFLSFFFGGFLKTNPFYLYSVPGQSSSVTS